MWLQIDALTTNDWWGLGILIIFIALAMWGLQRAMDGKL